MRILNGRVRRTHALQSCVDCKTHFRQNLPPDFQKKQESPETELHYEESHIQDPHVQRPSCKAKLIYAWTQDHADGVQAGPL